MQVYGATGGKARPSPLVARSERTTASAARAYPVWAACPSFRNLFRTRNINRGRTELLILIRPRVVTDQNDAAEATAYWRNRLSRTDGILETGLGSPQHSVYDFTR
jgi:general secretion pathway protein D